LQKPEVGVLFGAQADPSFSPNPRGTAHQPWRHPPFDAPGRAQPRDFKGAAITEHPSIAERMAGGPMFCEPRQPAVIYNPANRLGL